MRYPTKSYTRLYIQQPFRYPALKCFGKQDFGRITVSSRTRKRKTGTLRGDRTMSRQIIAKSVYNRWCFRSVEYALFRANNPLKPGQTPNKKVKVKNGT